AHRVREIVGPFGSTAKVLSADRARAQGSSCRGSATSWTGANGAKATTLPAAGLNGRALPLVASFAPRRPATRVRSRDRTNVRSAMGRRTQNGAVDIGARLRPRVRRFDPVAGFGSSRASSAGVAPLRGSEE